MSVWIMTLFDMVLWIEEQVALNGDDAPIFTVRSANSSARGKMVAGITQIEKMQGMKHG